VKTSSATPAPATPPARRRASRGPLALALALAGLLAPPFARPGGATLLRPLSLRELHEAAQWVARARVRAVSARWEGGRVISEALLEPLEVLRAPTGEAAPPSFTLRVLGGVVGDLAQRVAGSPAPAVGEEVVVFLTCRPDGLLVRASSAPAAPDCALVGFAQGYWRAAPAGEGAGGGAGRWAPSLSGVEWLGGRPPALGGGREALRAP